MPAFDDLLTDDATLATAAAGDFHVLVPSHQRAAYGIDGSLSGWTLSTAANLAGLTVGHVVRLEKAPAANWSDLLAVVGVDAGAGEITLRRLGMEAGDGPPPAPLGGPSGIVFRAPTALPQIQRATATVLRRFHFASYAGIATALDGEGDPEHFRHLATLHVLIGLLWTQHRAGNQEENFHTKYRDLLVEREAEQANLIDAYGIATAKPLRAGVLRLPNYRASDCGEF